MFATRCPADLLTCLLAGLPAGLAAGLTAQVEKVVAYPTQDLLSPFRQPTEVFAPPDRLFAALRRMRGWAEDPLQPREFDDQGREIIDHKGWRAALEEVERLGIDAAVLAIILRTSKNVDDRATALYATYFCKQADHVLNLIGHIPGEPVRRLRELALPRAIGWLQQNLAKKFGDLSEEQQKHLLALLPEPGSPAARTAGITRLPHASDHLYVQQLRLQPFFQLLDLDEPIDQAQGLWFLKEVFAIRADLALQWLEPALPRLRQLLLSPDETVREQTIGLLQTIGPSDLPPIAVDASPASLQDWADRAVRRLFPPIRNLNDTIILLQPSPEREALVAAGIAALSGDALGEPAFGKTKDGLPYRGYRIRHVPEALKQLAIPADAIITAVNGVVVRDADSLLAIVRDQLATQRHPRKLLVEYLRNGLPQAVEYRIE